MALFYAVILQVVTVMEMRLKKCIFITVVNGKDSMIIINK
jgi:hypothetical protein